MQFPRYSAAEMLVPPHKVRDTAIRSEQAEYLALAVIPVGIALNLMMGSLITALKLPIYLDAIGTIVITMLVGWRAGVLVGVSSFVLASILVFPGYIYFLATQVAIALYVRIVGARLRAFTTLWGTILSGIGLGVVAGCVSAPVIVAVFYGSTGTGRDLVTAWFVRMGYPDFAAVLLSGIAVEPLDKAVQVFVGCYVIRALPKRVLTRFIERVPI